MNHCMFIIKSLPRYVEITWFYACGRSIQILKPVKTCDSFTAKFSSFWCKCQVPWDNTIIKTPCNSRCGIMVMNAEQLFCGNDVSIWLKNSQMGWQTPKKHNFKSWEKIKSHALDSRQSCFFINRQKITRLLECHKYLTGFLLLHLRYF